MRDVRSIELQAGTLEITVHQARHSLDELLAFGSRQNPKRKYLFISKVLGKYIPCRPALMRRSYRLLAEAIRDLPPLSKNVWVMGIAETATALGAGVAEEIHRQNVATVFYNHTTRYDLDREIAFSICEAHSHAPSHIVYKPNDQAFCDQAGTVILVDDEVSTGRTLNQLTHRLAEKHPKIRQVVWVNLVNWLTDEQREVFREASKDVRQYYIEQAGENDKTLLESNQRRRPHVVFSCVICTSHTCLS